MGSTDRWVRNRVTEIELREQLDARGLDGRGARFERLELVAVEPPGWVQVFAFEVGLRDADDGRARHYGVLRDDERLASRLFLSRSRRERDERLEEWSRGLVTTRIGDRATRGRSAGLLLAVAIALVVLVLLLS